MLEEAGKEHPAFQSNARFRCDLYWASHSSLLIRAVCAGPSGGHLDLMFFGVLYLDLPRELWGVQMDAPTPGEVRHIEERLGRKEDTLDPKAIHVLVSEGRRYFIAASEFRIKEQPPGYDGHSLGE